MNRDPDVPLSFAASQEPAPRIGAANARAA
jgi:hypothetical protein